MDSCSWIVFLKKQRRTLSANHLMKTNLLTFFFNFTDLTENLNTLRTDLDSQPLAHLIFKNSASIPPLRTWCPICVLLISDILCCFRYCDNLCTHNSLISRIKHSKYTFVTLLKHFLPQNWIDDIFVSSYCLPSEVRFVTTNLPFPAN